MDLQTPKRSRWAVHEPMHSLNTIVLCACTPVVSTTCSKAAAPWKHGKVTQIFLECSLELQDACHLASLPDTTHADSCDNLTRRHSTTKLVMNKEIWWLKVDFVLNKTYPTEIRSEHWISQYHFQLSLHHIPTDPEDAQKSHLNAEMFWRLLKTNKKF